MADKQLYIYSVFPKADVERGERSYDLYYDCVVIAESPDAAKKTHPDGYDDDEPLSKMYPQGWWNLPASHVLIQCWAKPYQLKAVRIGIADTKQKPGVICKNFYNG